MAIWQNFIQTTLASNLAFGDTSMIVNSATAPWKDPVDASGNISYLTISDDLVSPTKFEIVSYETKAGFSPYTLGNMSRGLEGTTALNWSAGAYITHYLTAEAVFDDDDLSIASLDAGEF